MQKFTPAEYLKIDIANSMGLDKETWQKRLEWFNANEHNLLAHLKEAEKPAMFFAGVQAYNEAKAGNPISYPVSLDATASGMQLLSILTGDRKAAMLTNVLDTGERSDAYTKLFEAMQQKVDSKDISRADLKQAAMTAFYGSEAEPKRVFGEGKKLAAFFETLEEEAPYVWALNKAFLRMWDPEAFSYNWKLPDNFHVHVKVMDSVEEPVTFMGEYVTTFRKENRPVKKGRSIGANVVHSLDGFIVRELLRRCNYNPSQKETVQQLINTGSNGKDTSPKTKMLGYLWAHYKKSGYLSARILDYIDETNIQLIDTDPLQDLLDSMPEKPFNIIPVHDCFRIHPNYGNDLRQQYNLQLSLIAKSNMLSYLLSQLLGKEINIPKVEDFSEEILKTDYALS